MSKLDLTVEREEGILILHLGGRIDGANAFEFSKVAKENIREDDRAVILECANLAFMSSVGFRVLVTMAKILNKNKAKFAICSLSGAIKKIFSISGLDSIISVHPTLEEARANCSG